MRWLAPVFALAGCDLMFDIEELAPANELCLGRHGAGSSGWFAACLSAPPPAQLPALLSFDTDDGGDCTEVVVQDDDAATELCIIAARDITIGTKLTARGARPLVLAAVKTFEITASGGVSAASKRGQPSGAGANFTSVCAATLAGTNGSNLSGGTGGAGGSYQTTGARGGIGDGNLTRGMPRLDAEPAFVRGGCAGGNGGRGAVSLGGIGGASGGAVYLVAGVELVIAGELDASGESGDGGAAGIAGTSGGGGAGGGGSGGLIALDSPRVRIDATAKLIANGGPGGGGASSSQAGTAGVESNATMAFPFPSSGGRGGSSNAGGMGGAGANRDATATDGGNANGAGGGGGGGGGGGNGFIKVFSVAPEIAPDAAITPTAN